MGDTDFSVDQAHELSHVQKWLSAVETDRCKAQVSYLNPYSSNDDFTLCPQALDSTGLLANLCLFHN